MTTHFTYDTETLGVSSNSVILSIGIVPFVFEERRSFQDFVKSGINLKLSVEDQIAYGRKIDKKTLEWWKGEGEEAKAILRPSKNDLTMAQAAKIIEGFLSAHHCSHKESWHWSRGNEFDFGKITSMYEMLGQEPPYNGKGQRDVRTMIDCFWGTTDGYFESQADLEGLIKHNSLHDAAADTVRMQETYFDQMGE